MATEDKEKTSTPAPQTPAPRAKPRKLLVINHGDQVIRAPIMSTSDESDIPTSHSAVVLLPGANAVDPAAWDAVKEYPIIKALARRKTGKQRLEVGDPRLNVNDLSSFKDIDEALELIDQTVDADLLKSWKRAERRARLVEALEKQLEKIDPNQDIKEKAKGEGDEDDLQAET